MVRALGHLISSAVACYRCHLVEVYRLRPDRRILYPQLRPLRYLSVVQPVLQVFQGEEGRLAHGVSPIAFSSWEDHLCSLRGVVFHRRYEDVYDSLRIRFYLRVKANGSNADLRATVGVTEGRSIGIIAYRFPYRFFDLLGTRIVRPT